MSLSPTQNSKALLANQGFHVAVVEHWNSFVKIRQDAFGVMDIIAFRKDIPGVAAIQCTSHGGMAARVKKVREWELLHEWLYCRNAFFVHGWRKKKNRWQTRVVAFYLASNGDEILQSRNFITKKGELIE